MRIIDRREVLAGLTSLAVTGISSVVNANQGVSISNLDDIVTVTASKSDLNQKDPIHQKFYDFIRRGYGNVALLGTLNDYFQGNIRTSVREQVLSQTGSFLFGDYLDSLVQNLATHLKQQPTNGHHEYIVAVLSYFQAPEMDLTIDVNKAAFTLQLTQNYLGSEITLLNTKVAHGTKARPFPGNFFINRVVYYPKWYHPEWAKVKTTPPSGINNPFGEWMAELVTKDVPGTYNYPFDEDIVNSNYRPGTKYGAIRLHATNNPYSIGTRASSGCIRLTPWIAEEFYQALLHYTLHGSPKQTDRGFIRPFLNGAIPLTIKEA